MNVINDVIENETDIRNLIENWANAVRAKDLNGILANHSADIVMFDVPPPIQSMGLEEYEKTWDLYYSWDRGAGVFDVKEMNIEADDKAAFATALMRCAGTDANGNREELDFRLTIGLRKINGQWKITHEHHSVPAA